MGQAVRYCRQRHGPDRVERQSVKNARAPRYPEPRLTGGAFAFGGDAMDLTPQHGAAVVETDHPLTERERERILSDLQSIGLRAVILPAGVSLSHVAVQGLEDDE